MRAWMVPARLAKYGEFGSFSKYLGPSMGISAIDVIPLSHARAHFSELTEEVKAGAEKIVTKNGESFIALIDSDRLDTTVRLKIEQNQLVSVVGRFHSGIVGLQGA